MMQLAFSEIMRMDHVGGGVGNSKKRAYHRQAIELELIISPLSYNSNSDPPKMSNYPELPVLL